MRPRCRCGKIAGYWYAPIVYQEMDFQSYIHNHAYCESCANTDNWAEYMYIGFHKKDWRWFKKSKVLLNLAEHNRRMKLPGWSASHVKEDGVRWYLGVYGGYHRWHNCKCLEDVIEVTKGYEDVKIEERCK